MISARRVAPETADPPERRLRDVVEEMAIASGVRVPEVYVMDGERGIAPSPRARTLPARWSQ